MKDCPKPTLDKPIEPGDLRTGDKIGPFTVVANGLDSRSFKLSHLNANECPEHDWFSTSVVQSLIDAFGVSVHKPETPVMATGSIRKVEGRETTIFTDEFTPLPVGEKVRMFLESAITVSGPLHERTAFTVKTGPGEEETLCPERGDTVAAIRGVVK